MPVPLELGLQLRQAELAREAGGELGRHQRRADQLDGAPFSAGVEIDIEVGMGDQDEGNTPPAMLLPDPATDCEDLAGAIRDTHHHRARPLVEKGAERIAVDFQLDDLVSP
ncbi:MAG: hypothetical protein V1750_03545 [Acidobacteriota bacterium]